MATSNATSIVFLDDFDVIKKSERCKTHTFNGAIIAYENNMFTTNPKDVENAKIYNVYRNSNVAGYPCSISIKEINIHGDCIRYLNDVYIDCGKEDPRLFVFNNELYMSYNALVVESNTLKTVNVMYDKLEFDGNNFAISNDENCKEKLINYGHNNIYNSIWEKNWIFFQHKGKLCFVYSFLPFLIVDKDNNEIKKQDWRHPMQMTKFIQRSTTTKYRNDRLWFNMFNNTDISFHIRGGCPPVMVNDTYFFFAHTRAMPEVKYNIIVLITDIDLNVLGYSNILDINIDYPHNILFPTGAIYDTKSSTWFISCGLNDCEQVLVRIPHELVMQKIYYL